MPLPRAGSSSPERLTGVIPELIERSRVINHALGALDPLGWFRRMNTIESSVSPWTQTRGALFISFDCDTHEDAAVLGRLADLLQRYGFKGTFGVIGRLVQDDPGVYRELAHSEHEILAHGYNYHTEKTGDTYRSDLDYSQLSWTEVEEEIRLAKQAVSQTLGVSCGGFRTPHFGTFQGREQLRGLYRLLKKHEYRYSSSALMWSAKRYGFIFDCAEFFEFPLSSAPGPPISLIDSYNYIFRDEQRGRVPRLKPKWEQALESISTATAGCIYLNVYFDPHHIAAWQPFGEMLAAAADLRRQGRLWAGTYREALEQSVAAHPLVV
jgi:hypothetical protein